MCIVLNVFQDWAMNCGSSESEQLKIMSSVTVMEIQSRDVASAEPHCNNNQGDIASSLFSCLLALQSCNHLALYRLLRYEITNSEKIAWLTDIQIYNILLDLIHKKTEKIINVTVTII